MVDLCRFNHLLKSSSKTKEMVIDFHTTLHWSTSMDWQLRRWEHTNTWVFTSIINWTGWIPSTLYKKAKGFFFLDPERLRSFGACQTLLRKFYNIVVALSTLNTVVCRGGGCTERDRKRLNKPVKKTSALMVLSIPWRTWGRGRCLSGFHQS